MNPSNHYDVVIAGGGPGGSVSASRLAQLGRRVLVLEKEHFPRFHLGESLLPQSMPVLTAIGVMPEVERRFIVKRGANFHESHTGKTSRYAFGDAFDKRVGSAFQVPRDEFDQVLLRHAASLGAETREGVTVTKVLRETRQGRSFAAGVEIRNEDGSTQRITADFVIDATGRDALSAHASRATQRVPRLDQTALFSHFLGVPRETDERAGDIQIIVFEPGWFWVIPFADGRTSVGAVVQASWMRARRAEDPSRTKESLFWCAVAESPVATRFLADAKQDMPIDATADFSYRVEDLSGDGWLLVGDAGGFLDPLFSTGAHLAMYGGYHGAAAIDEALRAGDVSRPRFEAWETRMRKGASLFLGAVQAFYEGKLQEYLFADRPHPFMRHAITSMLSGDVFEGDDRWQREMRARFPANWAPPSA